MKAKLLPIVFIFVCLFEAFSVPPSPVPDGIYQSLRNGNSKNLSAFFNANIELVIIDKDGVYSRNQAQFIVNDFFAHNAPTDYTKLHEGGKEGSRFVIGQLTTSKGKFRIYFLMKNINGTFAIHQFRIENENN